MTDRAQFEAMLEALINDDQQAAKEIFHNIVVGKSREIYEELLAEDFSQDTGNPYSGKNEGMEEEESMEEDMEEEGAEEEEGSEEEDDAEGDDAEDDDSEDGDGEEDAIEKDIDDAESDADEIEHDAEEGDDSAIEDRVMDLEDALEDLKAEFEQLLAGEEHEEENEPGIHGDGMPMHDIEAGMGGMEDEDMEMPMMEYVNKVSPPKHGDNGVNTRSTIDNMKNDMGGSAKNIAQNHVEVHGDAGTKAGGTKGGLLKPTHQDLTAGLNVHNRPGSDAGKTAFKKQVPGGGIDRQSGFNKPGKQVGATDSSGKGESNTKSLISKRVR